MKGMLFRAALLAIGLAVLELGSWALLRTDAELGARLHAAAATPDAGALGGERARAQGRIGHLIPGGRFQQEVVHPYLGFVVLPPASARAGTPSLESLGFALGGPLVRERRPDTVVMAVFGGSVATYFAKSGGPERVFAQLRAMPRFAGKQLVVLGAAHLGYKQPQSLLALAWLQALGAKLDLVILLDGFNELVGPPLYLVPSGVFPHFPGHWRERVASLETSTELRALIGEIAYLSEQRAAASAWLARSPLRHSNTVELVFALRDRRLDATLEARRQALATGRSSQDLEYAASGPAWPAQGDALYEDLASFWMESSIEMDALARANDALFFHFLQPNQHLPGSKPMGDEERAVAVRGGEIFVPHVAGHYHRLRERGAALRARGVRFHDLTQVFADTPEPIYADNVGHVGRRGNEMLADAIAAAIERDLGPHSDATNR